MRRTYTAMTALAIALSLTACGSGLDAATRNITQVTDGTESTITNNDSKIKILNFLLVATEDGSAVVVGSIFNQSSVEDTLLGISVGSARASITGLTALKKNQPIRFEGESANAKAVFAAVGAEPGRNVRVTLGFARAGLVTINAIIRDKRDDYAGIESGLDVPTTDVPTTETATATPTP